MHLQRCQLFGEVYLMALCNGTMTQDREWLWWWFGLGFRTTITFFASIVHQADQNFLTFREGRFSLWIPVFLSVWLPDLVCLSTLQFSHSSDCWYTSYDLYPSPASTSACPFGSCLCSVWFLTWTVNTDSACYIRLFVLPETHPHSYLLLLTPNIRSLRTHEFYLLWWLICKEIILHLWYR